MTIIEVFKLVQTNEDKFFGQGLGDAGHVITGFEVVKKGKEDYIVNLIGEDHRSGAPIIKKPLEDWIKDNPNVEFSN